MVKFTTTHFGVLVLLSSISLANVFFIELNKKTHYILRLLTFKVMVFVFLLFFFSVMWGSMSLHITFFFTSAKTKKKKEKNKASSF